MVNKIKLLYLFPDVAYTADLVSAKSDGSFAIQAFHQVNGQFIDQDNFIHQNIDKLFAKLEKTTYQLVLPDYLFTNTIVNVSETEDDKIAAYLKNSLLPSLGINTHDYNIDTTILTTLKGSTKVQLSAIEKSLLSPVRVFADKHQIEITTVSPITWTLKSVISLEPSISLVQIGESVYAGLHYIGVDQTNMAKLNELEILAETIKTLKGSEPNIQTIYLISNALVEDRLKKVLSTTLPVQQLVTNRDDENKIPPYLKFAIESGARTLSIADYPVPKFELGKPDETEKEAVFNRTTIEEVPEKSQTQDVKTKAAEAITAAATVVTTKNTMKKLSLDDTTNQTPNDKATQSDLPEPTAKSDASTKPDSTEEKVKVQEENLEVKNVDQSQQPAENKTETKKAEDVDISQFAYAKKSETGQENKQKGGNKMLKMIFIAIAVFFATVAIGAGIGFGLLTLTNKNAQEETKVTVVTPAPKPTNTPTPTTAQAVTEPLSILVANATTKAGYAGATKDKILEANKNAKENVLKEVTAANAKGEYKKPDAANTQLLLMTKKNDTVKAALEKATGFKLEYADGIKTEDPNGKYDVVIVLVQ